MIKVALAGNPNCGKTTLFNSLTGSTAYVGNWPGVTVEKRSGTFYFKGKKGKDDGIEVIDLPGIYSLSPYTPEEVISRNFILNEKPDVVINVLDGTNLERNLYMTTQILEMDVPVVVAVNMMDTVAENGQSIDLQGLSKALGVPVLGISALREKGLEDLMKAAQKASKSPRKGTSVLKQDEILSQAKALYEESGVSSPLFHATKALEKDEIEEKEHAEEFKKVAALCEKEGKDYEAEIADARYQYLTPLCEKIVTGAVKQEKEKLSLSDRIDKVLTNRWAAFPIMIVILFLIFHFTFAGDLFYLGAMGVPFGEGYQGYLTLNVGGEEFRPFAGLFWTEDGINSIGEFFHVLAGDNETGILGLIGLGFKELLIVWNSPDWVIGFLYDGVYAGVSAVLGFVPQILILFGFFAILEDSGYMARIAFVLDRLFRRFGVSGRAFLPMVMGFGCGVPAMINTRTLASDKERVKTIRVIPFFTCGAKAEFLTLIAAAVASAVGFDQGLFTFLIYVFGVVVAIASVILMNHTTLREKVPPFIMELPAYHLPQPKSLLLHLWDKGKHFIQKAFTIILVSTIVVWFFANFTWDWTFIPSADPSLGLTEKDSILANIGMLIAPIFTPMGFGVQIQNSWIFSVASIQGIVAKESVTSTVSGLADVIGVKGFSGVVAASFEGHSSLDIAAALSAFAVFNMTTIPCFASVATAKGELGKGKYYIGTVFFWLICSYLMGCLTYVTIRWVWTLAISLPVIALLFVLAFFYSNWKGKKEAAAQKE